MNKQQSKSVPNFYIRFLFILGFAAVPAVLMFWARVHASTFTGIADQWPLLSIALAIVTWVISFDAALSYAKAERVLRLLDVASLVSAGATIVLCGIPGPAGLLTFLGSSLSWYIPQLASVWLMGYAFGSIAVAMQKQVRRQ